MYKARMTAWKERLPQIIQGGMGIGVSNHRLARAVALAGGLGVVSGTAIDTVMVRRLGLGDPGGEIRRALASFPFPGVAERILRAYFVPGGKAERAPFRLLPLPGLKMSAERLELIVAANYVEVSLAKEGHDHPIGVNYLEKIQAPTLASLLGAVLAGADVVLMGAGIPTQIPRAITRLAEWQPAELRVALAGARSEPFTQRLDPRELFGEAPPSLAPPRFVAIVSSHVVAKVLLKKASGPIDGFVVEHHTAGGHNAPPRKGSGYAALDEPDLAELRRLGVPFWLAGGRASPAKLREALDAGAAGVQVGTAFAYCEESGVTSEIKREIVSRARQQRLRVITDFQASPTGYPFKIVVKGDDVAAELEPLRGRARVCDLGYLRQAVVLDDGSIAYRCPSEPGRAYTQKGGADEDTTNKLCLCNQLLATVGLGQPRGAAPSLEAHEPGRARTEATGGELPLLTAGEEIGQIARYLRPGAASYRAADVMNALLSS